jgi:hypothetical protein
MHADSAVTIKYDEDQTSSDTMKTHPALYSALPAHNQAEANSDRFLHSIPFDWDAQIRWT